MKKNELMNGTIVELRNGDKFILLLNIKNWFCENCLISLKNGQYLDFDDYSDDLKDSTDSEYDIIKICQNDYVGDNFKEHIIVETDHWTWVRDEEEIKNEDKNISYEIFKIKLDLLEKKLEILEKIEEKIKGEL